MAKEHVDWIDILKVFLHDPPDKALDIKKHESRTRTYLKSIFGEEITGKEIEGLKKDPDIIASSLERLPMPDPGKIESTIVSPENGKLSIFHPLCGAQGHDLYKVPDVNENIDKINQVCREISDSIDNADIDCRGRARYLALWRFLPELLNSIHPGFLRLPADTRVPDHTISLHAFFADSTHSLAR